MITPQAIKAQELYLSHWNTKKTHCKHGHEFTEENTRRNKLGHRECIACHKIEGMEHYQNHRDALIEKQRLRRKKK